MPVTPPNLPHLGVYVAKDLGYFEEEGISVDLKGFESGLQSLRGGVAGGLDILGASSEPVIKAISRGAKIRSIFSYAHRLTVVMVAQEGVRKPADLRGKNLGIQEVGAFREVMMRRAPAREADRVRGFDERPPQVAVDVRTGRPEAALPAARVDPRRRTRIPGQLLGGGKPRDVAHLEGDVSGRFQI